MAPVVVDSIDDENVLEKMLEDETDFEERKKIRGRLRDIRRKKRDDREKRVNDMENDMFDAMVDHRSKHKQVVLDSYDKMKKTPTPETTKGSIGSTGLTSKSSSSSTTTTSKSSSSTSDKPKEDNNNTLIKAPMSTNKTAVSSKTSTSVKDDGKTTTTTTKSVNEGDGTKTVTQTTVSKSKDGDDKSSSIKQESSTTKTQSSIGGGSLTSSSKTVTQSSSSSSTSTTGGGKKLSKFDQQLEEKKKQREQKRLDDQAAWKEKKRAEMENRKKEKADADKKKASIMSKFGGVATAGSMPRPGGGAPAKVGPGGMVSASTIKQKLLEWAQQVTRGYANINITNFSSSWCDGMAFCAVVHKFYPEAFDYDKLNPKQRRKNFDLAFNSAEKYGDIMPLLETDDMLMMKNKPDWKCVFTYVQSLYRHLSKLQVQAQEA